MNGWMNSKLKFNIGAIILSAGKSGRLGEPKAFLRMNGETFIYHLIKKLNKFCNRLVIVFGFESEKMIHKLISDNVIKSYLDKIRVVVNHYYEDGMFSSIQCGIAEMKDEDYIIIQQVDQPGLPEEFYSQFITSLEGYVEWMQPSYDGIPGHPIIISRQIAQSILMENSKSTLRDFKKRNIHIKTKIFECTFPQIHQDIDTYQDYQKLLMEIRNESF